MPSTMRPCDLPPTSEFDAQEARVPGKGLRRIAGKAIGSIAGRFGTRRKRDEHELRIAAAVFESQAGMLVTDANGVVQRVNRAFSRITGYEPADIVGRNPRMLRSGLQAPGFYTDMWRQLREQGHWQGELVNRHRDGSLYHERLDVSAIRDAHGEVLHYVGSITDITREKSASARIEHLRYHDPLTELPNRSLLQDRLAHALQADSRSGEYGALLLLDLDDFKNVNDSLGHAFGDRVLVQAAQRMRRAIRTEDTLARFGGDTFAVLVEGLGRSRAEAATRAAGIAAKLRHALQQPFQLDARAVSCGASIGLTLFDGDAEQVDVLMREAELAMYRAKELGPGGLCFFEQAMQQELEARNALEADLRAALETRQFLLVYQGQYDARGRRIGAEALLRWMHPVRGLLGPGCFIELAEQTGLIEPLGQWVLEQACVQLAAWGREDGNCALTLAVNISARQFRHGDFVERVLRAIAAAGADPRRLKLEITESLALENLQDTVRKLRELRARGLSVALDDFGTGNSSLAYLAQLPLDQLKIDKSFVDQLPQDPTSALIVQAVLAMGHGMGLQVIAEGVETTAQYEHLAGLGCDAFQGFLFARPVAATDF
ncbi:bifunctional diguanylate cyclase/phosphodiesterase [Thiomonas sp. FB-6]|uniref:putative bifunctional diguanylate cyclase/phosphodiesterase n=1 Tax=Thiomonas sp. FB-6 TaxID=1158291 RepID=UPI00036292DD|nr:EAL domain-containing protein [Thiomonas sp. FB-6]